MAERLAALGLLLALSLGAAAETRTTRFSFSGWDVAFGRKSWAITTTICNKDRDGNAGTFDFQFRLVRGGSYYVVGSRHGRPPAHPGNCMAFEGFKVPVRLGGLPHGTYEVWIDLAEKTGDKWTTVKKVKLDKNFVL